MEMSREFYLRAGWRRSAIAAAMVGVTLAYSASACAKTILRVAVTQDLQVLDPSYGGGDVTSDLGHAVYDMLFGMDENNEPQPQMVDTYSKSADGLVYTFKLRPNLKFHSGRDVNSKDVIASIKRWQAKSVGGRAQANYVESFESPDSNTFIIKLKSPYSLLIEGMCTVAGIALEIMPEELASTDPSKMIETINGSGPFKFDPSRFRPGSSWVFEKNEAYIPRTEATAGGAGSRQAKVDEIEYRYFADASTAVNALLAGEVDVLSGIPYELLPLLEASSDINLVNVTPFGEQLDIRPNFLFPPFNDVRMRQALLYLMDSKELLTAAVGDEKYYKECLSAFVCGPTQPKPVELQLPNIEKAKELIKEAGYNGQKIVYLNANDQSELSRVATVFTERMHAAGLNVEQQDMDWATMTTRRANKSDPATSPAGWNLFGTTRPGIGAVNPILNSPLDTSCEQKNWFGWPCDDKMQDLRAKYLTKDSREDRLAVSDEINAYFVESIPYLTVGQVVRPTVAARKNVTGFALAHRLVPWNISKTEN